MIISIHREQSDLTALATLMPLVKRRSGRVVLIHWQMLRKLVESTAPLKSKGACSSLSQQRVKRSGLDESTWSIVLASRVAEIEERARR